MKIISGSITDAIFIARQGVSVNIFSANICTQRLMFSFCEESVPEMTVFKNCTPAISVIRGKIASQV